tara:strand:+ start:404 stop:637 length:234 start_codon:yes stop_codon:yes gene_type:complete
MRIIETELDNWEVVPELNEALEVVDMIDTFEIRNCRRETPLDVIVETLLDELYEAVQILEGIDTDVEYRTTAPQNGA